MNKILLNNLVRQRWQTVLPRRSINFGKAKHNIGFNSAATAAAHDDDGGISVTLSVGGELNENIVKGFYAKHGKTGFAGSTDTIKASTMGIAAKAGIGLTDGFRALSKWATTLWKVEQTTDEDGTDFLYGSLEYKLSATTAVVAGYDRFTYDTDNITDTSIGICF